MALFLPLVNCMAADLEFELLILILGLWQLTNVDASNGLHYIDIDPSLCPVTNDLVLSFICLLLVAEDVYDLEEVSEEVVQLLFTKNLYCWTTFNSVVIWLHISLGWVVAIFVTRFIIHIRVVKELLVEALHQWWGIALLVIDLGVGCSLIFVVLLLFTRI